jgi:DNA-binding beta-propeller fold protein YncE
MTNQNSRIRILTLVILMTVVYPFSAQAEVKASFLYSLSDFTGTIPYSWARVSVDDERNEVYVAFQNNIRVFNEAGMEIYRFGDDLDLGRIVDLTTDKGGDILLLTYQDSKPSVVRCNYRGEPVSRVELKNVPSKFRDFFPNRMVYRNNNLYFASLMGLTVVVTDVDGDFKNGYDLFPLLDLEEKDRGNLEIGGFSVDKEGNILFTIAVLFRAYILSPDAKLAWFGKPGAAPGRFNVVAGIVADSKGNYLIVDKLKSAVMVFDKKHNFVTQFGYRGLGKGNLITPHDIAIDNGDRIYVTQGRKKGVSVFKLAYN